MEEKIRIPIPDPLGIFGDLTKDMPFVLFDPLINAAEIEKTIETSEVRDGPEDESPSDVKIRKYTYHLEQALKFAPCPGCKQLILSSLVGVEIFKAMEKNDLKREDFTDEEIQNIKKRVYEKYGVTT